MPHPDFFTIEHQGENIHRTLWWGREQDREGENAASQRYARIMKRTLPAVLDALDAGRDFDLTIQSAPPTPGHPYDELIHIPAN